MSSDQDGYKADDQQNHSENQSYQEGHQLRSEVEYLDEHGS
jgi:hypothetical protein